MPLVKLQTSQSLDSSLSKIVMKQLSSAIADATGKSEQVVMVTFATTPVMMNGELVDGAFVEVRGIGKIDKETNNITARAICEILKENLAIDPVNIYLNFMDIDGTNWARNSQTIR